ncbi:type I-E CRISPR-associated protein Cas6/Cse3/CasE [Ligilactobacillus equi]|uniref:CRISPR associated family protein n=1 Tax=Ligilactobacillus equi DSM 15833 = JCM 10991 TaxID=1423740 RepID=A0A0R1T4X0_9LACO|nr:type I-E CRISPR-associated protein Cas6/Cse3/CasE [Ligilactobacillus equi]KRL76653.1 CRISPR associated family protein [Ligilactobacillus equi DSM 15833 = JCM 10991]
MYLSRVEIDDSNRRKLRELTHLGAYHNWVEQSFPAEVTSGLRKRHLWRIDTLGDRRYLLLLSEEKPEVELLSKYGVNGSVIIKSYANFINNISKHQTFQFRLVANPTHTKDNHVYPHVTIEQQKKWLLDRTAKNGFEILCNETEKYLFDIVERDYPILRKKNGRKVKLSRVAFSGLLKVTDESLFQELLVRGIGREKAYGMGLMTVIPR